MALRALRGEIVAAKDSGSQGASWEASSLVDTRTAFPNPLSTHLKAFNNLGDYTFHKSHKGPILRRVLL